MPRRREAPVVASRGAAQLLGEIGFTGDLQRALEAGAVARQKLIGRWLYFAPETQLDTVISAVSTAIEEQLRKWLLSPPPYLRSPVARTLEHRVTADAVEVILPQLVHVGDFGALGLLTAQYQPYLALYSWADEEEIGRQLRAMTELLERHGSVRQGQLPEPMRQRDAAGWKSSILKHGEFLGLGFVEDAALIRWEN